MSAAWTPEREAELRDVKRILIESGWANDEDRLVYALIAELDRVREERDGMRARVLRYAAELDHGVLAWERPAARLRELVAP